MGYFNIMKLEKLVAALCCSMIGQACTSFKDNIPADTCNSSRIGLYHPADDRKLKEIGDIIFQDGGKLDRQSLGMLAHRVIDDYFNSDNEVLTKELLGNIIAFDEMEHWGGMYFNSAYSNCPRDVISIKRTSSVLENFGLGNKIIHESLHDVWDRYLKPEQRDEFLKISKKYFQKVSYLGTKNDRGIKEQYPSLDFVLNDMLRHYSENQKRFNADHFLGTEVYAFIGHYIVEGKRLPKEFLKFYEKILAEDVLNKAKAGE